MRIAVASSGLGRVTRGIETWALRFPKALIERGIPVQVYRGGGQAENPYETIVSSWGRSDADTRRLLNWLPQRFLWRLGITSEYGIEQTTFALNLLPYLNRDRIDILHVKDPQVALIVQRARQMRLIAAKVILSHGTEESFEFQKKIIYLQHQAPWHLQEAKHQGIWKPTWTAIPNF